MVSQKGAIYDDDSSNRGDAYFSDNSQGSKTTNASSLDTTVSGSANEEGIELVAGHCRAHNQARKYNECWAIHMGPEHSSVGGIRARERREL
jgi:hypothetical protein